MSSLKRRGLEGGRWQEEKDKDFFETLTGIEGLRKDKEHLIETVPINLYRNMNTSNQLCDISHKKG